jgi:NAD(P)-dependent dehydrogenase (short-subunit alcohol dehydrogenase family)
MDLQDRSIMLTGAGGGISAALALELAARSARLTLVGQRRGPLDEDAAAVRERGGQAHVQALNLTGPGTAAGADMEQDALMVVRGGATRTAVVTLNSKDQPQWTGRFWRAKASWRKPLPPFQPLTLPCPRKPSLPVTSP